MVQNSLNTENPNHFIYPTEQLNFEVLGGLTSFGIDRMRVTLKVSKTEDAFHAFRHNIDLYNSNGVEKLVRKLAEFLEIGTSIIR